VTVSDAALRAVGTNALRHLLEADQHYKAGRYASATASAVLSIEGSGKLGFLAATGSMPKAKGAARHGNAWNPRHVGNGARRPLIWPSGLQQESLRNSLSTLKFTIHRERTVPLLQPRERWAAAISPETRRNLVS
jgi:hypothetical protein